ncbi:hypothetical protein K488DRAFT_79810 [Vararia minispora EC-137]|uniref:Uncharacterized protein n=1 Tax=Vararia minispora EC-137 TaxID=1314806 RepID=A0ACB8QEM9_9AGAM|nr:hypothetical protein K488DRAFT_79810 [Vararia minispora EC-137]
MVLLREKALFLWRNEHSLGSVFSSNCTNVALPATTQHPEGQPCEQCSSLWHVHTFQNALNREMPDECNMKNTPKGYRNTVLGKIYLQYEGLRELVEGNGILDSPWLRFAKGAAAGAYKSQEVVLGLVEALMEKAERACHGKQTTNMHYTEALDTFCSLIQSISPRAFKIFRHVFAGRSISSIRSQRAKAPKFIPGIAKENAERASAKIIGLNYTGPVALSWDDTDIEQALTLWETTKGTWTLLGAVGGPLSVSSEDSMDEVFANAKLEKASKLRVWIPPILLAAVARSPTDTAEALAELHFSIIEDLHQVNIHPISVSADGTESERKLQRLIEAHAHSVLPICVANNEPSCTLRLDIPCLYKMPFVRTQDSKHGQKTMRNQLLSGSRALALGNYPIYPSMLRDFADHPSGPLFAHDVHRVDKQDDCAAARLFSANALSFHLCYHEDQPALSIYIFVLGELVDAWQNRRIRHVTRARMALRARFVLMAWHSHTERHPHHQTSIQFISRESFDIFLTLCDSLLQLIIVHRQVYPAHPLLPWLHSTEACEHIFGMLRQLKTDFTYADLLYLEPKLQALLMGAYRDFSPQAAANAIGEGYHHTYFDLAGLDISSLMVWPSDAELGVASNAALHEACLLLGTVGLDARDLLQSYRPPAAPPLPHAADIPPPERPQTLAEALALFSPEQLDMKSGDADVVYQIALAAENADQTVQMYNSLNLPDLDNLPELDSELEAWLEEFSLRVWRVFLVLY